MMKEIPRFFPALIWLAASPCGYCATMTESIFEILEAKESELESLWKRHREHSEFSFLVLDRWAEISPEDLLKQDLTREETETAWQLWGRHDGKGALKHLNSRPDRYQEAISSILKGYGESRPREVLSLTKDYEEILDNDFVRSGMIRGFSLQSPIAAIDTMRNYSSVLWKQPDIVSHESTAARTAIWRWLNFESEHALNYLVEDEDPPLNPEFVAILASKIPEKVEQAFNDFPTGLKKVAFEKGLLLAKEGSETLSFVNAMASPLEINSSHTFKNLVKRANETPPESFTEWLVDAKVEHLDPAYATLLRAIAKERWTATDPLGLVRFQVSNGDCEFANILSACLEKDHEGAIQFVESLGKPGSYIRHLGRRQLIEAIGRTNVPEALKRYQRYAAKDGLGDQRYEMVFLEMAGKDRETFLEFALKHESEKHTLMVILAGAWLPKDPDWTIKTLESHDINPFKGETSLRHNPFNRNKRIYIHNLSGAKWNPSLFEAFDSIPESWRTSLIDSRLIYLGAEILWLRTKAHPVLSEAELESIHRTIANNGQWMSRDDQNDVKSIIAEATWLNDRIKGELATWIVIRDSRGLEKLKPWIDQLPPAIRQKPLETYEYFDDDQKRAREKAAQKDLPVPVIKHTEELLGKLLKSYDRGIKLSINEWTEPEIKEFHSQVKDLTKEQILVLSTKIDFEQLPWRVRASLIPKCFENEQSHRNPVLLHLTRATAKDFATYDPAKAATWANSIPSPRPRDLAFGDILDIWKSYDKEEALQWVARLPTATKERLGY